MTRNVSNRKEPDAGKPNPDLTAGATWSQTEKIMSNVLTLAFHINTGDTIAIRADNGLFLSRMARGDLNPIEAEKDIPDWYSRYKVTILDNGKIALQADSGLYLSRIARGDLNPIEAAKDSIDVYSQFGVFILPFGLIALQADSGLYLSRMTRGDLDPIEAVKDLPDRYSQFSVILL